MAQQGHQSAFAQLRFWREVDVAGPDDCWRYRHASGSRGYGRYTWGEPGQRESAHRVAFFMAYAYWPENALHTCDHRWCCNPGHLYDGTRQDNTDDMVDRGRGWWQKP